MTEFEFKLNTAQSGEATFESNKIRGTLKAIIVKSDKAVVIEAMAGDFKILGIRDFSGSEYFAVRRYVVNEDGTRIGYTATEWDISDKLNIKVSGNLNANVDFKFIFD